MSPVSRGEAKYFFVHLQKTAGTTLFRRLRNHFGPDAVYPRPEDQGDVAAVLEPEYLARRFAEHRAELLGSDFVAFTLLREPVERTLSFLRHQRQIAPEHAGAPLETIYADPMLRDGLVRNHMVRMLSLTREEMTGGALTRVVVDDARLERAQRNLVERIDTFGIQEDFEAFCHLLTERFGWDLGPAHVSNTTRHVEVPESLRERIASDNAMDAELYRFAFDHWSRRSETQRTL
jgi:hypothetical protein